MLEGIEKTLKQLEICQGPLSFEILTIFFNYLKFFDALNIPKNRPRFFFNRLSSDSSIVRGNGDNFIAVQDLPRPSKL